jgi:hypothetical protein
MRIQQHGSLHALVQKALWHDAVGVQALERRASEAQRNDVSGTPAFRAAAGRKPLQFVPAIPRATVTKKTKIDTLTFTGRSGAKYDLRVYVWETAFKAVPGVYVVVSRSVEPGAAPIYQPLFVGITNDLSKVFEHHPRHDCFQLHYANTIGVIQEREHAARDRIAADLIGGLAPPCNAPDAD